MLSWIPNKGENTNWIKGTKSNEDLPVAPSGTRETYGFSDVKRQFTYLNLSLINNNLLNHSCPLLTKDTFLSSYVFEGNLKPRHFSRFKFQISAFSAVNIFQILCLCLNAFLSFFNPSSLSSFYYFAFMSLDGDSRLCAFHAFGNAWRKRTIKIVIARYIWRKRDRKWTKKVKKKIKRSLINSWVKLEE